MIIGIDERKGSRWPTFIVLAALCGLLIVGAGVMQQRTLAAKIDEQGPKAAALTRQTIVPATKGVNLTKPFPHAVVARLDRALDASAPAGDTVLRVRVFAEDGTLLYSSVDRGAQTVGVGNPDAIRAAVAGATTSVIGADRVSASDGKVASVELLQTYVELPGAKGKPSGVVGVDERYHPLQVAAQQPWHTIQLGLGGAAAVFMLIGLAMLTRRASVKRARAKARARAAKPPAKPEAGGLSQGEPTADAPEKKRSLRKDKEAASPAAPAAGDAARARKDAQREIQVREALEGQLEQLRTRIREGEDAANRQVLELTQQLQMAAARVEEAEARATSSGGAAAAQRLAAADRQAQEAAQRAEQAQARVTSAEARVAELEARLADVQQASVPPPTDERVAELERALAEATTAAADSARRADATEAVRDELEIKVAQFGSRAQEQEATASAIAEQLREVEAVKADLERRAHEAETGGDAVRADVAQLTAERESLRTRVGELERAVTDAPPQPAAGIEELEQLASARAELHDLRQQLGLAIERARAAEERSTKLEADLLAEREGVRELDEALPAEPVDQEPVYREPDPGLSTEPFPSFNGNGAPPNGNGAPPNGDTPEEDDAAADAEEESQGDKSLRYRLAQSAARKKGLGDLELPS